MSDFWIKIVEEEDEEIKKHHYLVSASDAAEARKAAMAFIKHFCDEDDNPTPLLTGSLLQQCHSGADCGYQGNNQGEFKSFLLKTHTIQWK